MKQKRSAILGKASTPKVHTNGSDDASVQCDLNAERAECVKERDDAYETLNKDQAEYDKQLLTLSAGFLVLSLAFVKDVVPLQDAAHLWVLYTSFCLTSSCVLLVLSSYQYSIQGNFRVAKYWELKSEKLSAEQKRKLRIDQELEETHAKIKRHAGRVRAINLTSGAFFLVGVALLVCFVIVNIQRESQIKSKSKPNGTTLPEGTHGAELHQNVPQTPNLPKDPSKTISPPKAN